MLAWKVRETKGLKAQGSLDLPRASLASCLAAKSFLVRLVMFFSNSGLECLAEAPNLANNPPLAQVSVHVPETARPNFAGTHLGFHAHDKP